MPDKHRQIKAIAKAAGIAGLGALGALGVYTLIQKKDLRQRVVRYTARMTTDILQVLGAIPPELLPHLQSLRAQQAASKPLAGEPKIKDAEFTIIKEKSDGMA